MVVALFPLFVFLVEVGGVGLIRERHLFKRGNDKIRQKLAFPPLDRFPSQNDITEKNLHTKNIKHTRIIFTKKSH